MKYLQFCILSIIFPYSILIANETKLVSDIHLLVIHHFLNQNLDLLLDCNYHGFLLEVNLVQKK